MTKYYDLVIIGAGPAGLTAAIYALRANLNILVIDKNVLCGGQILNTYEVDNYPGLPGISGIDLGMKLKEHAELLNAQFVEDEVCHINVDNEVKVIQTDNGIIQTKSVIIASGASHRLLNVPGEEEFSGMGVSYCATCDGAFFKNKEVVIVGGGDAAVEDAIYMARICKKVYLIHRRNELRAAKSLQNKLFSYTNVEILWNSSVEKINGEKKVASVNVVDNSTNAMKEIAVEGVFVAIGIVPNPIDLSKELHVDVNNYIIASEDCCTNINGVFVAGDLRTKELRQIVTAVADGANAVYSVENYLNSLTY